MKIRIGQILRVEHPGARDRSDALGDFASYYELTRGAHAVGADISQSEDPGRASQRSICSWLG